jgi:hypothetical protein
MLFSTQKGNGSLLDCLVSCLLQLPSNGATICTIKLIYPQFAPENARLAKEPVPQMIQKSRIGFTYLVSLRYGINIESMEPHVQQTYVIFNSNNVIFYNSVQTR